MKGVDFFLEEILLAKPWNEPKTKKKSGWVLFILKEIALTPKKETGDKKKKEGDTFYLNEKLHG